MRQLAEKTISLARQVWETIVEVLKGVAAPVLFFKGAFDWEDVRGLATDIAGELKPDVLRGSQQWRGAAAEAYRSVIGPQGNAAARVGVLADKIVTTLNLCAFAGLAFYVAIGLILAKFLVTMAAVIAALASVAFSWAGVVLAVEEAGIDTGMIVTAVTTLVLLLGAQAEQLAALHGEAMDHGSFPGGRWPDPVTGAFDSTTVAGARAGWSLS